MSDEDEVCRKGEGGEGGEVANTEVQYVGVEFIISVMVVYYSIL